MSLEGSTNTADNAVQVRQDAAAEFRKLKREVRQAQATGRASQFLRDEASRSVGVSRAVDSTGKKVDVVNIPSVGIVDFATGKSIAAMMVEDPIKKGGSAAAAPPSLPSQVAFDVCEDGNPVTYLLYGSKVVSA